MRQRKLLHIWLMDVGMVYKVNRVNKPDFLLYNIGNLNKYLNECS